MACLALASPMTSYLSPGHGLPGYSVTLGLASPLQNYLSLIALDFPLASYLSPGLSAGLCLCGHGPLQLFRQPGVFSKKNKSPFSDYA